MYQKIGEFLFRALLYSSRRLHPITPGRVSVHVFVVMATLQATSASGMSTDRIAKIVCIYDQPLKSENIPVIIDLIKNGRYSRTIETKHFSPGTSVWIYVPEIILRRDTSRNILITGYQDYIDVYAVGAGTWKKMHTGGKYVPSSVLPAGVGREYVTLYENPADISKGGYLIACRKYNNFNYSPLLANLRSQKELLEWQLNFRLSEEFYPKIIFPLVGVLITTVLHLLVLFFLSKNWSYSYHAIGLLFTLTFFILCYYQYPIHIDDSRFDDPKLLINFDCFVLFLALACNFMSVRGFYDTGKWVMLNNKITRRLAVVSVVVAFCLLIFSYSTKLFYIENYLAITLEPIISGIYIIHLIKIRSEIRNAFRIYIIGLCFLSVFLEAAFILSCFAPSWGWEIAPAFLLVFPMIIGISIFNGFIITAVITRNYQTRLESMTLRARAIEAEMVSIQKGMNPHFIFNCLNLIDYFLYQNDSKSARRVLFNFSDLLRLVVDKSPNQMIPLSDELKILELYINLEKSRTENSFVYSIVVAPEVDPDVLLVPPLIIQPIVENAIKHGILNRKKTGGQINIVISKESGSLFEIEIDDNGAGRRIAEQLRHTDYPRSGHVGISHTEKRLAIISEMFNVESYLEIMDKHEDYAGTTVRMRLPALKSDNDKIVLQR
ncbi:histidine kinase [Dyadobacter sp. 32]|uniref:sensor histidine kinase n=1 Tax=Dyadobacter sp. 32 TaxID=538966 RepID=UPI0011EDAA83